MSTASDEMDAMEEIHAIFSAEADERVRAINGYLMALEKGAEGGDRARILAELFREAHSLKGAAGLVGLEAVESLAHHLESLFGGMQGEGSTIGSADFDVVYRTVDAIQAQLAPSPVNEAPAAPQTTAQTEPGSRDKVSPPPLTVATQRPGDETIRVSTAKIDSLMAEVGELLVARASSVRHLAGLDAVANGLIELEGQMRKLRGPGGPSSALPGAAHESDEGDGQRPLTLGESQIRTLKRDVAELRRTVVADARRVGQVTTDLQEDVRRTRMLPVSTLFEQFPRMVRDLAREHGKDVDLVIAGGETEVDRSVLEQMKSPLTHLLRNAIDHGIESPEARAEAGKGVRATIGLAAIHIGSRVVITVEDDGKGIDPARRPRSRAG